MAGEILKQFLYKDKNILILLGKSLWLFI